jgi:hypothetical protein
MDRDRSHGCGGRGRRGSQQQFVTDSPATGDDAGDGGLLLTVLPWWLALAAVAQVAYLAHWPMFILGTPIPRAAAVAVALVRLGVYAGLAAGIAAREPTAWAGTLLEMARSFLLFAAYVALNGWSLPGSIYPAGWAQGVLGAALPVVILLNALLSAGWRPGPAADMRLSAAARIFAALCGFSAISLRRKMRRFNVRKEERWTVVLLRGLPVVLVLSVVEGAAFLLAVSRDS